MLRSARFGATLPAADMDRAKGWYRDKLGVEPTQEQEGQGSFYEIGETGFMLYPSEYAGTNKATAMGIIVDDFDATVEGLRSRGVEFLEFDFGDAKTEDGILTMPDGQKGAWFTDSEGNILAISDRQV